MDDSSPEIGVLYRCRPKFGSYEDVCGISKNAIVLLIEWKHLPGPRSQATFLFNDQKVYVVYSGFGGFCQEFVRVSK